MATHSLQYLIKAQLDNASMTTLSKQLASGVDKGIVKNLNNQLKIVEQAIEESTNPKQIQKFMNLKTKIASEKDKALTPTAGAAMKEMGSGFLSMFKPMNIMTGLVGQIAGGVAVVAILAESLEPALDIVKKVLKLAGEVLRPIGEIISTMIRPLFGLLMPIVRVMNTIMMPFRQAANLLASSAMKDFAEGITKGDGGLIAKGVTKSILGGVTIFTGFITAIEKILITLQKATITGLYQLGTTLFYKPMIIGLSTLISVFGSNNKAKQFAAVGATGLEAGKATLENVFGLMDASIDTQADIILATIKTAGDALGVDLSSAITKSFEDIDTDAPMNTFLTVQGKIIEQTFDEISFIFSDKFEDAFKDKSILETFNTVSKDMASKFSETITKGWEEGKKAADAAIKAAQTTNLMGKSALSNQNETQSFIDNYKTKGMNNAQIINAYTQTGNFQSDVDNKKQTFGIDTSSLKTASSDIDATIDRIFNPKNAFSLPASTNLGFSSMADMSSKTFNLDSGSVTAPVKNGMKAMGENTRTFGSTLGSVATIVKDATQQVQNYARAYYDAMNKIKQMEASRKRTV